MFGYLLVVAGAVLVGAGVEYERKKGAPGWDKFRLDKIENGKLPFLLEEKLRELARQEGQGAVVDALNRKAILPGPGMTVLEATAEDPKKS